MRTPLSKWLNYANYDSKRVSKAQQYTLIVNNDRAAPNYIEWLGSVHNKVLESGVLLDYTLFFIRASNFWAEAECSLAF